MTFPLLPHRCIRQCIVVISLLLWLLSLAAQARPAAVTQAGSTTVVPAAMLVLRPASVSVCLGSPASLTATGCPTGGTLR